MIEWRNEFSGGETGNYETHENRNIKSEQERTEF